MPFNGMQKEKVEMKRGIKLFLTTDEAYFCVVHTAEKNFNIFAFHYLVQIQRRLIDCNIPMTNGV